MPSRNCASWSRIWIRRGTPARCRGTPPLLDRHQLRLCTSRSPRIPAGVSHLGPRPSSPASPPPSSQQPAGSTRPPVPAHQEAAGCGTPPLHHPDHSLPEETGWGTWQLHHPDHSHPEGAGWGTRLLRHPDHNHPEGAGLLPDCSITLITVTQWGQGAIPDSSISLITVTQRGRVGYLTAPSPWSQSPRGVPPPEAIPDCSFTLITTTQRGHHHPDPIPDCSITLILITQSELCLVPHPDHVIMLKQL